MTLEEKISFYTREDAVEFQKFLRENDCSSRISIEHVFSGKAHFEGSISSFKKLFSLLEEKEGEEGEVDEEFIMRKKELDVRRDLLDSFFKEHKAGDIIEDSSPNQLMTSVSSIDAESDEEFNLEARGKFLSSLIVLATLDENNLLKDSEDGNSYILTETMEADELRIRYECDNIPDPSEEELKECNISTHIMTASITKHVVTTSTEFIFVNGEELSKYFDDVDVDIEDAARAVDNLFFKQALIGKIHELIDSGCTSVEKLSAAFEAPSFPLAGTENVISFDITPEYLKDVLSDLKKLELISGKDGKFKNM